MGNLKAKINREEESHVKITFSINESGTVLYGTAILVDGKLAKFELVPSDYKFKYWFVTKERLRLLRRFLKAVEKEIAFPE